MSKGIAPQGALELPDDRHRIERGSVGYKDRPSVPPRGLLLLLGEPANRTR